MGVLRPSKENQSCLSKSHFGPHPTPPPSTITNPPIPTRVSCSEAGIWEVLTAPSADTDMLVVLHICLESRERGRGKENDTIKTCKMEPSWRKDTIPVQMGGGGEQ